MPHSPTPIAMNTQDSSDSSHIHNNLTQFPRGVLCAGRLKWGRNNRGMDHCRWKEPWDVHKNPIFRRGKSLGLLLLYSKPAVVLYKNIQLYRKTLQKWSQTFFYFTHCTIKLSDWYIIVPQSHRAILTLGLSSASSLVLAWVVLQKCRKACVPLLGG